MWTSSTWRDIISSYVLATEELYVIQLRVILRLPIKFATCYSLSQYLYYSKQDTNA